jgi:iron complex outermembrane receptor protein
MFQRTKICTGLLLAFGSLAVYAQDADVAPQRVEITGSSIKRVDAESALPVQVLSHEDIAQLGVTSTEELLSHVTANSMVGGTNVAQGAGASTYGESTVSLRGLGANRTLVLVNGRRLANYATDGTAVDINSIPISAVDHVEVLKDGASGVYGSDAVAGVVNFILRKDFKGVEVGAFYGKPTTGGGGKDGKGSITVGFGDMATTHFNVMGSLDFEHSSAIYGYQRPYADRSWDNGGAFDVSATPSGALRTYDPSATPGVLNSQGSGLGNPLAVGGATGNTCAANGSSWNAVEGTCRFNSSPFVPLTPDVTRVNGSLALRARVNDDIDFFAEGFLSNNKTVTREQPSPYSVSFLSSDFLFPEKGVNPAIVLNPSNPAYQSVVLPYLTSIGSAAAGQPVTVSYRAFDGGPREHTDNSLQTHFTTGFEGNLKGWDFDSAYSYNASSVKETTQSGYQSQLAMVELLSGNDAFNPYAATQTPALAKEIAATNYVGPMISSTLSTQSLDIKGSHDLYALPGGDLTLAVGASLRKEELNLSPSAAYMSGDISGYGGQVLPLDVSRNSHSVFAELYAPILKSLDADLSVRNDHYPNASSTNPKLSMSFTPVSQVKLRGSVGTGFREPSLPELDNPQTVGTSQSFQDPVTGVTNQYNVLSGGNPGLKPEKSKQFSFGVVLEPIKNLSATVDYWHIRITNDVTVLDPQFIVDQAAAGVAPYTGLVTRDNAGNINLITSTNINAGSVMTSGVDVDVKWKSTKSSWGGLNAELNGTWTQKYNETLPDGTVQQSVGNTIDADGNPLNAVSAGGILFKWKHTLEVGYEYGPYEFGISQNYQSKYNDSSRADCSDAVSCATPAKVKAFQTFDLQGAYTGIKGVTLRLGAKNFTNRQPPQTIMLGQYFQVGYDPTYYDPHGRFIYGSATYKF